MPLARTLAALAACAVLAGCGASQPAAVARAGHVDLRLDEFLIAPQDVTAPRGRVTFAIADRGRLRHSFRLWGPGGEPVRVETLFPNHAELGMTGRLYVR
jgi:hypothetical protein